MSTRAWMLIAACSVLLLAALFRDVSAGPALQLAHMAAAAPPVSSTTSMSFACPAFNHFNPDAGSPQNGVPECSSGQSAVKFENETANAVYFCGKTGCTQANHASAGFKRCTTCTGGHAYEIAGNRFTTRCISGTADAGVTVAVQCAQY